MKNRNLRIGTALVTVAVLVVAYAAPAQAGCLREFEQCGDCAAKAFWAAVGDWDVLGAIDAWIDTIDCEIDLYHCTVLGQHHDYSCAS